MAPTLFRSRAFLILLISFIFFSLLVFRHPDTILKSIPSRIYALSPYSASAFSGCPDIHAAGSLPPINHHAQTCSPVVSASDDFSLSVCHDPTTCNAFTLHITRSDPTTCAEVEATRILSSDPELDEWIRTKLGPDSFEILTNGAERMHSALATYEGGCKWRFDIQLWNAGRFWVNVWHTYESYAGYDEKNSSWPDMLRRPLLQESLEMSICSSSCEPFRAPRLASTSASASVKSSHIYPPPSPDQLSLDQSHDQKLQAALPVCSTEEVVPGSYLPQHPMDILYPPAPLPTSEVGGASEATSNGIPVAGRYTFVPHGCTHDPNLKGGRRFSDPSLMAACTSHPKRVMVIGDSHGRVIADGLAHRLSGNPNIMTESEKSGHKQHTLGSGPVDIQFWWDPKGDNEGIVSCTPGPDDVPISEYDVLIVSVAAHVMGHDTTTFYRKHLESILQTFNSCEGGGPKIKIYVPAPAMPNRVDKWPREYGDVRTNQKIRKWDAVAREVVQANKAQGWRYVDHTTLTAPFAWDVLNLDSAHFLGTDALDPVLDDVLVKMELCA